MKKLIIISLMTLFCAKLSFAAPIDNCKDDCKAKYTEYNEDRENCITKCYETTPEAPEE